MKCVGSMLSGVTWYGMTGEGLKWSVAGRKRSIRGGRKIYLRAEKEGLPGIVTIFCVKGKNFLKGPSGRVIGRAWIVQPLMAH